MKIFGYKVRDRMTGLYLAAGKKWSKTGKVWTNIGHLKNATNTWTGKKVKVPPNWELIVLGELATVNADIVLNGKMLEKHIEKMIKNKLEPGDVSTLIEQNPTVCDEP